MATALITGASNGIGLELAKVHASRGGNLVLVARSKAKLDALKKEWESSYKIEVYTIGKDLSLPGAAQEVYDETAGSNMRIDYLINNAGFGDFGPFCESDWNKQQQMITLNIQTLTHFCHLFLPRMIAQGGGKIMNLASTAAFQPGPTMAVYFATKAYVLHFSEAIGNEVKDNHVTVTALCPGPTQSGFQEVSGMDQSALVKGKKLPASSEVAVYGYKAMLKGKAVAIPGFLNTIMAGSISFVPRSWAVQIARKMQDKAPQ